MHSFIITGPESTGKTTLAEILSQNLTLPMVGEYARVWMDTHGPAYSKHDVIAMETMQRNEEYKTSDPNEKRQLVDSDVLTFMVWVEDKFGGFPKEWLNHFKDKKSCTYLLCYPDIPWKKDPYREDENRRLLLFNRYQHYLDLYAKQYIVIKGSFEERYKLASKYILDMS